MMAKPQAQTTRSGCQADPCRDGRERQGDRCGQRHCRVMAVLDQIGSCQVKKEAEDASRCGS
jgi:hypothetical protein